LALLDDVVLAFAVGVAAACVVVLSAFLGRYRRLTLEADKASRLAKDVWDAVNARLTVMDARIIDVMAKVEINSVRTTRKPRQEGGSASLGPRSQAVDVQAPVAPVRLPVTSVMVSREEPGQEVEVLILRTLVEGRSTSNQIMAVVNRSREHTARLMKSLYDKGLVIRNDRTRPYVYEITDVGRRYLEGS